MTHQAMTAGLAVLTAIYALSASSAARAQTTVRIPRINNQAPAPPPPVPASGNAAFAYVSTPSLRRQALESYLARIARKNPGRAKMLAADFSRTDADKFYQRLILNTGLKNYDVADALTAYQLTGWIIANNVKTMPPRSRILAARRQTAAILAKDPGMTNSAARGKAGEEFKLLTVTLHFGLLSARRSGHTKAYADEIAALFDETGPNPRSLTLTDTGFAARR
jgi:hypothetical protein